MIINAEEMKEAARKGLQSDETVRFFLEAHLQRAGGMELEGLLGVTDKRLLFVHRPLFAQPEMIPYDRASLEITGREEDLWGAKLKARAGSDPIEFRRMAPPDFKQLWAELGGAEPEAAGEPVVEGQLVAESLIQTAEPIQTMEAIGAEPIEEQGRPKIQFVPPIPTCYIHHDVESKTRCDECGKPICPVCATAFNYKSYCPHCLGKAKKKFKTKLKEEAGKKPPPLDVKPTPRDAAKGHPPKLPPGGGRVSRSPALAFLLSFIPGFGQFYNNDGLRGMIVILSFLLIFYTPEAKGLLDTRNLNLEFILGLPYQFFVPFMLWFVSFFDAAHRANKRNAEQGVRAQPAGCSALLLILLAFGVIGSLAFILNTYYLNPQAVKNNGNVAGPPAEVIPASDLERQQIKIRELLKLYYSLQYAHYVNKHEYMEAIPPKVRNANDTGYRLGVTFPGKRRYEYRFFAWTLVGDDKHLDLWSITNNGAIVHDYSPEPQ